MRMGRSPIKQDPWWADVKWWQPCRPPPTSARLALGGGPGEVNKSERIAHLQGGLGGWAMNQLWWRPMGTVRLCRRKGVIICDYSITLKCETTSGSHNNKTQPHCHAFICFVLHTLAPLLISNIGFLITIVGIQNKTERKKENLTHRKSVLPLFFPGN